MSESGQRDAPSTRIRQSDSDSRAVLSTRTAPFPLKNRYCPLTQIAETRLGPVFEARDDRESGPDAERRVAVQVFDSHIAGNADLVRALRRGFEALSTRQHPNLPEILDFDSDERFVFVVTDLLEGVTARAVLDDAAVLPYEDAAPIVVAIGDALECLHAESIVHGNVASENVLIAFDHRIRLLDTVPLSPDRLSDVIGVEPAERSSVPAPRDDVYGLACLAYELMAGQPPFAGRTPVEARREGLEPAPIASMSERQWRALTQALALDPDRRTPSVADFLAGWLATHNEGMPSPGEDGPSEAIEIELEPSGPALTEDSPLRTTPPLSDWTAEPTLFGPQRRDRFTSQEQGRPSGSPAVVAVVAVGILAAIAWFYYPPVREGAFDLIQGQPRQSVDSAASAAGAGDAVERSGDTVVAEASGAATDREDDRPTEAPAPDSSAAGSVAVPARNGLTPAPAVEDLASAATAETTAVEADAAAASRATLADLAESRGPATAVGRNADELVASDNAAEAARSDNTAEAARSDNAAEAARSDNAAEAARSDNTSEAAGSDNASEIDRADSAAAVVRSDESAEIAASEGGGVAQASGAPAPSPASPSSAVANTAALAARPFEITEPSLSRAENAGFVPVVVRRTGDPAATESMFWWISEETATADDDYADFGETAERFAAGEATVTLLIPLVNDGVAEPAEHFFVHVGRRNDATGALAAVASVRVDIIDDD